MRLDENLFRRPGSDANTSDCLWFVPRNAIPRIDGILRQEFVKIIVVTREKAVIVISPALDRVVIYGSSGCQGSLLCEVNSPLTFHANSTESRALIVPWDWPGERHWRER